MARQTHNSVSTTAPDARRVPDAPLNGLATKPATSTLDRSSAPHIAPALRALAVPIDSIALHPRNPRRGNVEAVAASLARFGQQKPLVVQASSRYVVAGNHLLRAARGLGWSEIAANVQDMDDAEATAFMLADNRTADLGGYDDALLAAILAETQAADNLAATGYDNDAVASLLAGLGVSDPRDADAVPDPPTGAELYVRPGDLWLLGRHRLLCGDGTDGAAVTQLTEGAPIDLLWTDPPYGVAYVGKTSKALTIANDRLDGAGTRALVARALHLTPLRAGGVFYVASPAGPAHLTFLLALADAGLTIHETLIWVKDRFVLGRSDYHYRHEPILYGWSAGPRHRFVDDRTQDSVWEIPRPTLNELHPTMKPVALVERAIRNSSREGDRVYDPFAGSGTTLIAAEQTGRIGLAIELDPAYCQVIIERWQSYSGGTATRLEGSGNG